MVYSINTNHHKSQLFVSNFHHSYIETEDACKSTTLVCTFGQPCTIICTGKSACMDANILGQGASDVAMRCIGEDACKPVTFNCGTGRCKAECTAGLNLCVGMVVNTLTATSFECVGLCPADVLALVFTLNPTISPTSFPSKLILYQTL